MGKMIRNKIHAQEFNRLLQRMREIALEDLNQGRAPLMNQECPLPIIPTDEKCPYCESVEMVKNGKRHTQTGWRQRYKCKMCSRRFVLDPLKNHKLTAEQLSLACDLYFKGCSLRDVQDTFKRLLSFNINHETIRQNILKVVKKMKEYCDQLNPKLSKQWGVDEQMVKCKGKWKYAWNLVDKDTRYLIASNITKGRSVEEAREIFKKAKKILRKDKRDPDFFGLEISSDGLKSYIKAIRKEFLKRMEIIHKPTNHPQVDQSENMKVERYHNQYREFDKIRRDFKTALGLWNDGYRIFYNLIQSNNGKALNGQTPAQAAGIDILGGNRWLSMIKLSLSPLSK